MSSVIQWSHVLPRGKRMSMKFGLFGWDGRGLGAKKDTNSKQVNKQTVLFFPQRWCKNCLCISKHMHTHTPMGKRSYFSNGQGEKRYYAKMLWDLFLERDSLVVAVWTVHVCYEQLNRQGPNCPSMHAPSFFFLFILMSGHSLDMDQLSQSETLKANEHRDEIDNHAHVHIAHIINIHLWGVQAKDPLTHRGLCSIKTSAQGRTKGGQLGQGTRRCMYSCFFWFGLLQVPRSRHLFLFP